MDKLRTVLFGMTGFGNSIAETMLSDQRTELVAVFTNKRQLKPFPYYSCSHLHELASAASVKCHEGLNLKEESTVKILESYSPDLIVVSTFNQVIPAPVIQIPRLGTINIHPSLLPRYRGTTPTVWALLNGEKETGVTAHFIEDERIDTGRIICQTVAEISSQETDGSLRFRLAELSKATFQNALDLILSRQISSFPPQDESKATYFRKRTEADAEINVHWPLEQIKQRIRAMAPYPGAYILQDETRYFVQAAELMQGKEAARTGSFFSDIRTDNGIIRFYLREGVAYGE